MTKDRTRIDATTFNASETLFEMTDSSNLESDESCHRENHSIEHPEPTSNHIADHNFQGKHEKLLQNYPGNVKIDGCTYFLKKESILFQDQIEHETKLSYSTGLIGILILISSIALSLIVTLWPQHNSLLQPEYWYEALGVWIFGHTMTVSISDVFERNKIMEANPVLSWKPLIQHFFSIATPFLIIYVTTYIIWVYGFGYCHPMPFVGLFCYLTQYFIFWPISFWLLFPSNMRNRGSSSRHKIFWFICLMLLRCLLATSYTKVTILFLVEQEYLQPSGLLAGILGVFLPLAKKFNFWWHRKISLKVFGSENEFVEFGSIIVVGYLHSFSLALLLGSPEITGSNYTKYLIMFLDSIFNTWTLINILKLHAKQSDVENSDKRKALKCLALKEFLEIFVPSIYCISFVIAYYGPNADIIGNVKNDYWQFEKVENLVKKFENVLILLIIEACRGLLFGIILRCSCRLNMFTAYCYVIRHYGVFILFFGSAVINGVI